MSQDLPSVESYEAGRLLPNTAASGTFFFSNPNLDFFFLCEQIQEMNVNNFHARFLGKLFKQRKLSCDIH